MEASNVFTVILNHIQLGYEVSFRRELGMLVIELSKNTWIEGKETRTKMSQMIPFENAGQTSNVIRYIETIITQASLKLVNDSIKKPESWE